MGLVSGVGRWVGRWVVMWDGWVSGMSKWAW